MRIAYVNDNNQRVLDTITEQDLDNNYKTGHTFYADKFVVMPKDSDDEVLLAAQSLLETILEESTGAIDENTSLSGVIENGLPGIQKFVEDLLAETFENYDSDELDEWEQEYKNHMMSLSAHAENNETLLAWYRSQK